jgi:hypothetical protein
LRLSLRSFCSSSVSNEPSSTSAPANGSTLNAIGLTNFSGVGNATALPSWVSSAALSTTLTGLLVEFVDAGEPAAGHRLVGAATTRRSRPRRAAA